MTRLPFYRREPPGSRADTLVSQMAGGLSLGVASLLLGALAGLDRLGMLERAWVETRPIKGVQTALFATVPTPAAWIVVAVGVAFAALGIHLSGRRHRPYLSFAALGLNIALVMALAGLAAYAAYLTP